MAVSKTKPLRLLLFGSIAAFLAVSLYTFNAPLNTGRPSLQGEVVKIPAVTSPANQVCTAIHWHPHLEIIIQGEKKIVPANIGIFQGKVMDEELAGADISPIHTHDASGTLHMENNCIEKKPETVELGYFFSVWQRIFNRTCIFDNCNDGRNFVSMTVNGVANREFEKYKLGDGDEIVISYGKPQPPAKLTFLPVLIPAANRV